MRNGTDAPSLISALSFSWEIVGTPATPLSKQSAPRLEGLEAVVGVPNFCREGEERAPIKPRASFLCTNAPSVDATMHASDTLDSTVSVSLPYEGELSRSCGLTRSLASPKAMSLRSSTVVVRAE